MRLTILSIFSGAPVAIQKSPLREGIKTQITLQRMNALTGA